MGLLYSHYEANPKTNLNINAVSGTLTKTFKDSYFVRFAKNSPMENFYFREAKPSRITSKRDAWGNYKREDEEIYNKILYSLKEIIVLQVMLCGDDCYLVEAIDKEDYEKYSKKNEVKTMLEYKYIYCYDLDHYKDWELFQIIPKNDGNDRAVIFKRNKPI